VSICYASLFIFRDSSGERFRKAYSSLITAGYGVTASLTNGQEITAKHVDSINAFKLEWPLIVSDLLPHFHNRFLS